MATPEHCLYCFETLSAKLETRKPLSLQQVQKLHAAYLASLTTTVTTGKQAKQIPALRRLVGNSSAGSGSSSTDSLHSGSSSSTSLSDNTAATSVSSSSSATATPAISSTSRERVADPYARYPLFVTWDKRHGSSPSSPWHLRGCIGTFSASEPLHSTLSEYALISALHDTRFSRVSLSELTSLRCCVTLLTNFEECSDVDDWVVGEHGIRISFVWQGRRYGSTYLPSVAPEQGWNKEQTMVSLMRKAGWEGKRSSWREVAQKSGMRVERYRGDKEEVEHAEFVAWREWVKENWKGSDEEDDDEDDDVNEVEDDDDDDDVDEDEDE
ncbi:AMMECR1 domain-containing protein [Coniella lustricola]|uniref:AMMECR1 domain-containing protein n=1 Tax=Coniella lustricola TaxID=2025994 RepID=A0A2T3AHK1_9PEZI|nr:AMMECR1 domain-containing protein [Coniella lustricola]